jgi:hypothetical protein
MAAIYSNGDNRWNILGFNFTKRDALSSVYKISMRFTHLISLVILTYCELSIQTRFLKKYFQIYRQAVRKFALNFKLT